MTRARQRQRQQAAERQRRRANQKAYRDRRRALGLVAPVPADVDVTLWLVDRGFLDQEQDENRRAVGAAIGTLLRVVIGNAMDFGNPLSRHPTNEESTLAEPQTEAAADEEPHR